jgi:fermentation-respiration switch protein FrsA (DUF1100 family)
MKKGIITVITSLLLAAVLLVAFNAWIWFQQASMIFVPMRGMDATPADWGLEYQEVILHTSDGVGLYGWYLPSPGAKDVLLFFHGNAGNISQRGESLSIFHRLGLNVLIIDYRGYGRSGGAPSEEGLNRDAEAAWRYLRQDRGFAASNIVLFGRSLGGAVAARLATEVKPAALILESTFSSARDVATAYYPILSKLILLRFTFDTVTRISTVDCPLLLIHSPDDQVIPFYMGERVYKAAHEPKSLLRLHGDHNRGFLISQPEYQRGLRQFLDRYVTRQATGTPAEN